MGIDGVRVFVQGGSESAGTRTDGRRQMTDPEFCFGSNVQNPNRLLRFHDAPELLRIHEEGGGDPSTWPVFLGGFWFPRRQKKKKRKSAHVGRYPRFAVTGVQTQSFPIWSGSSADLHIVDVLHLSHLLTFGTTRRTSNTAFPKLDAPEGRYAQRGINQ